VIKLGDEAFLTQYRHRMSRVGLLSQPGTPSTPPSLGISSELSRQLRCAMRSSPTTMLPLAGRSQLVGSTLHSTPQIPSASAGLGGQTIHVLLSFPTELVSQVTPMQALRDARLEVILSMP